MANITCTIKNSGRCDEYGRPLIKGSIYSGNIDFVRSLVNSGFAVVDDESVFDVDNTPAGSYFAPIPVGSVPVSGINNPLTGESRLISAGISFPHISNARCLNPDLADGVVLPRCTTTNGSNVINCPDGAFTSADVGKYFSLYSMDTASLTLTSKLSGTIIAVNSPTQFQASANATATIATDTNGRCFYGTDRAAEVQALLNLAATRGGFAQMPTGLIACASDIVVPGNVILVGNGYDYPSTREFLSRGSALIRLGTYGASGAFVTLGDTPTNYTSTKVKPQLLNIGIDAAERHDCAVMSNASRTRVDHCTIWRGESWGLKLDAAGDPWVTNNRIGQMNKGTCVKGVGDMHLFDNHIRGSGNGGHQIYISAQSDFEICRNHMFKGGVGTVGGYATLLGNNIYIQHTGFDTTKHSNWSISDNIFDGTAGHHIQLAIGSTANTSVKGVRIQNNHFFQNSLPNNTYSFLNVAVANSSLVEMNVSGNTGIATLYDADTNCYKNFAEVSGSGTIISNVSGNMIDHCLAGCVGFTPTVGAGTNVMTSAANAPTAF